MNKIIKVPTRTYLRTLCIVIAHVIIFALLRILFLPEIRFNSFILIGIGFYVFKVVNYFAVSIEIKDDSIIFNGFFKKGILIPFKSIEEIEIEGPSQFNSNYMLAFYGKRKSSYSKKEGLLARMPIYWFSRNEVEDLLEFLKKKKPAIQFQKQLNQYLKRENRKTLLTNYLIQYIILIVIIIVIIVKNN